MLRIFYGNLAGDKPGLLKVAETELTIPAPLRHKKKVKDYENSRKK